MTVRKKLMKTIRSKDLNMRKQVWIYTCDYKVGSKDLYLIADNCIEKIPVNDNKNNEMFNQ